MQTADPIAVMHGLSVHVEPRLIEMDIGELEGFSFADLRQRHPELLWTWAGPDGPQTAMPGGERLKDVQTRAVEAVQSLREKHSEHAICAVTHNFVILSLLAHALGIDLAGFRRLRHALGGITTLEIGPEESRLITLNDTCHLNP
jgi:probable phosphoglycerate mutase